MGTSQRCEFLITRGKRKGLPCGAKAGCGNRCRVHHAKRPLVAAPKNLFYDLLPTDLQDYIIKMPLVEEILHNEEILKDYEILEGVRKNHFIQLNQMHRTRSAPYTRQKLLNLWCRIMKQPLSLANEQQPFIFDNFVEVIVNKENDPQSIQTSKMNELVAVLSSGSKVWSDNCTKYLHTLYSQAHRDPPPDDDDVCTEPEKMRFFELADLKRVRDEQEQLKSLYRCFENPPSDPIRADVCEKFRDTLLFQSVMFAMMSDFIMQRRCLQCERSTTSRTGYCAKCAPLWAPPSVNLFDLV